MSISIVLVGFRIVQILLETHHVLCETVHEKRGWTEICWSQSCWSKIIAHGIGKTIWRIHFETTELLVPVFSNLFKIVRNIGI